MYLALGQLQPWRRDDVAVGVVVVQGGAVTTLEGDGASRRSQRSS